MGLRPRNAKQLYTLEQAKVELYREECRAKGHKYLILTDLKLVPEQLSCDRCGRTWPVGPEIDAQGNEVRRVRPQPRDTGQGSAG